MGLNIDVGPSERVISPNHPDAEPDQANSMAPVRFGAGWLRFVVLAAAVLAGIVVVWSLLKGADRNLWRNAAQVVRSPLLLVVT